MAAYVKNYGGNWQTGAGGGTPITEAALDNLETQYDSAISMTVNNTLYDANSIVVAILDNTPVVQALAASTIIGRAAAGNVTALTVAQTNLLLGRYAILKTATETVNNNNVPQADDELLFAVGANETWHVFLHLLLLAANATPNIQFLFTVPAGGSLWGFDVGLVRGLAAGNAMPVSADMVAVGSGGKVLAVNAGHVFLFWGMYVGAAAAGNVTLTWAQHIAHASNTQVLINSGLFARQLF